MINQKLSHIFAEMAVLLEIQSVAFKPRAYEHAAYIVGGIQEDLADMYTRGGLKALEDISGIGKGIAEKIEEYIKHKHIAEYEHLKKQLPVDVNNLIRIEGIGPKKIALLYQKLGIKNVAGLKTAIQKHQLRELPGFGEKTEQKIAKGIEFLERGQGRLLLGRALSIARAIVAQVRNLPGVLRAEYAGSIRCMQETIGDLDLLIVSRDPNCAKEFFSDRTEETLGLRPNVRVVPPESFGAALQYFTGDKYHNVILREIAIKKGYKLNEYGLYKGEKMIAGKTEEEIYEKLGLKWMEPELRTNNGEFTEPLPKLIGYSDLKGDLQVQSDWTDGQNSIRELAEAAKKLGHEYIAITDHTRSLAMTGGADEAKLERQMREIDNVQKEVPGIKILKGAEVNIMKDGTLDINNETLAKLDVVGAAVHSLFNMAEKDMTARIIRAMENPHVDILFHPTGRVLEKRDPYNVDMDAIIATAKRTGTILEIDAHPARLDLKDEYIRKAVNAGVKLVIDSDAHAIGELSYLEYGIGQARRGWATKDDVINTRSWQDLKKLLKNKN